jgi:predicted adenine nucleotide alpha hydrolase (AANH) superfamily ATPase
MRRLCDLSNISLLVGDYDCDNYITAVSAVPEPDNYEGNGKNSGKRCAVCFRLRLSQTAKYAASNGYDAICTTLTVSPHKCSADINRILAEVAEMYGVTPLICDFKKKDGYLKSLKLSEKYALYRQDYCGCGITTKKILPILQNEIGNIK